MQLNHKNGNIGGVFNIAVILSGAKLSSCAPYMTGGTLQVASSERFQNLRGSSPESWFRFAVIRCGLRLPFKGNWRHMTLDITTGLCPTQTKAAFVGYWQCGSG